MENLNYVIHLFHSGGYVMYPLLLLSFMVIAIAAERAFYYRKYAGKTFVVTHAVNELAKLQNWAEIDKVIKENDHAMDDIRYFANTILAREYRWADCF